MIRAFYKPMLLYGYVSCWNKDSEGNFIPSPDYFFKADSGEELYVRNINDFEFFHSEKCINQ